MEIPSSQEPSGTSSAQSSVPHDDIHENKDLAAISYVWILAVVIYITKRQSPFVNFHAKQALILFALSLIVGMFGVLGNILLLVILGLSVLGFLNAAQGLKKDLPFIGPIARADIPALKNSFHDLWESIASLWKKKPHAPSSTPHSAPAHSPVIDVASTPVESPSVPPSPPAQ